MVDDKFGPKDIWVNSLSAFDGRQTDLILEGNKYHLTHRTHLSSFQSQPYAE